MGTVLGVFDYVFGALFLLVAVWLVWVPVREYRHAQATGAHRISFSRMLLRMIVAVCLLGIGLMVYLATRPAPGRSALAELIFLCIAVFLALVMFSAGVVDWQLAKRDLLLSQKELIREMIRRETHPEESISTPPSRNGHGQEPPLSSNGHDPSPS